ncbi:MAG: SDR family NAD(P)-dependent oxidoreductase [Gammaproteobacteria bacterium]|nr:SDR family NAD(P)-dependent oxidoreductase [Gammaproteobacteria bacterium]NNF50687.1 SDR family NAD(P)-dependent oxidoreductase [Woeseiaceae bacterium]MBT8094697.1 SDR family NAD(P)-dependent oxidoreductase [Gammaproteobacteria bacterium]MBT8105231.1 SDR family NAD(P)-dependent oxidoreductase [Gammaproteobacteria bacterium]NNK25245.1 SDR family NAD(P)-dependent oxidoreductase [Woeseiaceae bacterium]
MQMILRCFAAAALVFALFSAEPSFAEEKKSILITGASTGIGRNLAETLAGMGHHVYAGARKDEDLAELDAIDNITAVRLDVTKQEQIDAVVALIKEKGTGLYGLVNNAGVGAGGPVLEASIEDTQFVYAVNVEGVYRTTKAFAPLVIESKGRIATTGSIAGVRSGPGWSTYAGSKHWMEAFADSLAGEMEPLGVHASIIEPGSYQSNIRRSGWKRAFEDIEAGGGEITDEMKQAYEATAARELSFKEPDDVSAAFVHALFDEAPLRRYIVVPRAKQGESTIRRAIARVVQLNEWGPYSLSRDELVEMLDEALAE